MTFVDSFASHCVVLIRLDYLSNSLKLFELFLLLSDTLLATWSSIVHWLTSDFVILWLFDNTAAHGRSTEFVYTMLYRYLLCWAPEVRFTFMAFRNHAHCFSLQTWYVSTRSFFCGQFNPFLSVIFLNLIYSVQTRWFCWASLLENICLARSPKTKPVPFFFGGPSHVFSSYPSF